MGEHMKLRAPRSIPSNSSPLVSTSIQKDVLHSTPRVIAYTQSYSHFMETIPGYLERLPDGEDRGRAEMLARDPRERILVAMYELVAKRGYRGTTIEHIVKRAGISRATFYEHFDDRDDCLL